MKFFRQSKIYYEMYQEQITFIDLPLEILEKISQYDHNVFYKMLILSKGFYEFAMMRLEYYKVFFSSKREKVFNYQDRLLLRPYGYNCNKELYRSLPNGTRHGMCTQYDLEGNLVGKCNYQDGMLQGSFEKFFPDGRKCEIFNYFNDKLSGEAIFYYPKGSIDKIINYIDNKQVSEKKYRENGALWISYSYEDNRQEYTFFRNDGSIKEQKNYYQGKVL